MSVRLIQGLQRYLRRLGGDAVPSDDTVLLNRFVTANDRQAFELLMARHGPMVLATARRLVDNAHDAEDVFQAVFLSLARLAKTIRQGTALPAWLHQTTCRIAAKARKNRAPASTGPLPEPCDQLDPHAQLVWREVRQALDEELQCLPDRLRSPLLLCYLSGLTRDEAAQQLGWSLATLKRRLEEGRKALRIRLERRGITAVGLALTVLSPASLQAAVSDSLLASSLRLIFSVGTVPATISALVLSSASPMKGVAMKAIFALLLTIAAGLGTYAGMGQTGPSKKAEGKNELALPAHKAKVGGWDDPLPAGSTLRFGTSLFRLGLPIETMPISADGQIAVAVSGGHAPGSTRVFDLVSGRTLYALGGWQGASIDAAAISPDRQIIVTKEDFSLRIRNAATGKELRKIELKHTTPYSITGVLAFTPDGRAIAVTSQGEVIHLIELVSGRTLHDFRHDGWSVRGIAFSRDGKRMAVGGYDRARGRNFTRLWEMKTGKELRLFKHGQRRHDLRALAFSPDGKTLATGADDGQLRLFDVDTGKVRKALPRDSTYLRSVAFAPDGKIVAVSGSSIRLYDVTTGKERLRIDRTAIGLQFTDGGKTLTGAILGAIYRWDTVTGKTLTPEPAGDSLVEQVLVTADGTHVVTRGRDGDAHLWDAATGKHLRHFAVARYRGLALSRDGRFLAWPVAEQVGTSTGSRLKLYDLATNRFVERFRRFKGDAHELAFAPDGKTLVTVDHDSSTARVWDVAAGKELRSFRVARENEKTRSGYVWSSSLSPDGATLAVTYHREDNITRWGLAHPVRLYDVATGTERHDLPGHLSCVNAPAFSPDGKRLVTASPAPSPSLPRHVKQPTNQVFVWDVATGKPIAGLPDGLPTGAVVAAFSPDGRMVALALGADLEGAAEPAAGTVRLYETATWTVRAELRGGQGQVTALAFTPSGRLLTGGLDTTVLAWDVRPPRVAASVSLEGAWNDLAAREAGKSFKSEGRFLAAPAETVKLFAERIKPAKAPGPKQRAGITSEQLRQIRAVMILERIGDGEAKNLLKRWAGGPVGARSTVEASQALKRLGAVSKAKR
jgi:RNA polymerase sigma factor (sigma-70 family)